MDGIPTCGKFILIPIAKQENNASHAPALFCNSSVQHDWGDYPVKHQTSSRILGLCQLYVMILSLSYEDGVSLT